MELSLETQLNPASETDHQCGGEEMNRARMLAGLDRYLQASGVGQQNQRHRLAKAILHRVGQEEMTRDGRLDWAALIAAVDAALSDEHAITTETDSDLSCRGRIAQAFVRSPLPSTTPAVETIARGTPMPSHRPMPPQTLSTWRPRFPQLGSPMIWRPAQSLVISLCCLALVFVP